VRLLNALKGWRGLLSLTLLGGRTAGRGRAPSRRAPRPALELGLAPPAAPPAPAAAPPRPTPAEAEALLADLRRLGLKGIERLRFTRNRTVMVSFSGGELRVHEGYRAAPAEVRRAVAQFVSGRTRAERARAREAILAYQIPRGALPRAAARGRAPRTSRRSPSSAASTRTTTACTSAGASSSSPSACRRAWSPASATTRRRARRATRRRS
jgi:hypothetical protein